MTVPADVGGLMLNVGCGDRRAPAPWVNCDSYPGVSPDVIMDATAEWPFATGTVARVYMGQIVEHLDHPVGVRAAFAQARRVLRQGGLLAVVTPDFAAVEEKRFAPWIRENLTRGECRWLGDEHRWCPDRHEVLALVSEVFADAHVLHPSLLACAWPDGNRDAWDCAVIGVAGGK